ncbi:MAG: L-histidine N(alpha)-methyltransferase [bacterium]
MSSVDLGQRISYRVVEDDLSRDTLAETVRNGFEKSPRQLPPRVLYDGRGSALYREICNLSDYYPAQKEEFILNEFADEIVQEVGFPQTITELGCGSAEKTRGIIETLIEENQSLDYEMIDISDEQLREAAESVVEEYDSLTVTAVAGDYISGLERLPEIDGSRVLLFLGGSLGNFDPEDAESFLRTVRQSVQSSEGILVGVDLVKDPEIIEQAYNDSEGVTAQFNKNILRRINKELGGRFRPEKFRHEAPFVEEKSRIEMRLVSEVKQRVFVEGLSRSYEFDSGDYIHTESSYKYEIESFEQLVERAGYELHRYWTDPAEHFALTLLKAE